MSLTLSIVTPSYNQGDFLEAAMHSVLDQRYHHLEYVVMDGGSTDNSVSVIETFADQLHHWQSKPDDGHYAAINAGFAHTNGEIMAWLNSDDLYTPWTFGIVAEIFGQFPEIEWLTAGYPLNWNRDGLPVNAEFQIGYSYANYMRGAYIPGDESTKSLWNIQQESTFWRRSLWEKVGGAIDTRYTLAGDFDLWTRFFQHTPLYTVQSILGGFRSHGAGQRSAEGRTAYVEQCKQSLRAAGGHPAGHLEQMIRFTVGRRVPRPLNGWLRLAYPAKIVKFDIRQDRWMLQTKVT
jgi:glycosyltransferase involved in cell wall biosynthesis